MNNHFEELKKLGWFDLTLDEFKTEAEKELGDCVSRDYVGTNNVVEEGSETLRRMNELGLGNDDFISLDFRVFGDDPENLSEGDISKLLKTINTTYKLRGTKLFEEANDDLSSDEFAYSVNIDGEKYKVYSPEDEDKYSWGYGVKAVIDIVDKLLEKIGDPNRMYYSCSGDNSINFFLLTPVLFEYLDANKIDGGLGPITKKVDLD